MIEKPRESFEFKVRLEIQVDLFECSSNFSNFIFYLFFEHVSHFSYQWAFHIDNDLFKGHLPTMEFCGIIKNCVF